MTVSDSDFELILSMLRITIEAKARKGHFVGKSFFREKVIELPLDYAQALLIGGTDTYLVDLLAKTDKVRIQVSFGTGEPMKRRYFRFWTRMEETEETCLISLLTENDPDRQVFAFLSLSELPHITAYAYEKFTLPMGKQTVDLPNMDHMLEGVPNETQVRFFIHCLNLV